MCSARARSDQIRHRLGPYPSLAHSAVNMKGVHIKMSLCRVCFGREYGQGKVRMDEKRALKEILFPQHPRGLGYLEHNTLLWSYIPQQLLQRC